MFGSLAVADQRVAVHIEVFERDMLLLVLLHSCEAILQRVVTVSILASQNA